MSKIRVLNPANNTDVFGTIPALTLNSHSKGIITTTRCSIHLVEGKHVGPNSGFGVAHIWAEHKNEIMGSGFASIADVPNYVQNILLTPNLIYFEDRKVSRPRVNAVRIVTGTVILEYIRTVVNKVETPHWSVITAYSNPRTAGVLVGNI